MEATGRRSDLIYACPAGAAGTENRGGSTWDLADENVVFHSRQVKAAWARCTGLLPGLPKWDESFVILAMWASVEAIFLSTFVLISQNRLQGVANQRPIATCRPACSPHEVTKLVTLVSAMAERVSVRTEVDRELDEITNDVAPEAVLDEIEANQPRLNRPTKPTARALR